VDGFLSAKVSGLTNTLRFIHKELVNIPGVKSLYGQEIRECLIARESYELCGSDMTSLEDLTKRHYMFPHDPEFVKEMSHPNYDPHISLAAYAGAVPAFDIDDAEAVNKIKKLYPKERQDYKKTNYSATYGIQPPKLSRELRTTEIKAKKLLDDFWGKNWSIKAVAAEQKVKVVDKKKWLYNPVSKFYYSLREEKDRFSTLNQGTGVYCFDSWIREIRKLRPQLTGQFHDEIIIEVKKGNRDKATQLLQNAIKKVNERLKLNVELSIDIKYGDCYADIH
jgi:DNA polymerase I-like protein with 3'-5' exonuclease and polymerase domains